MNYTPNQGDIVVIDFDPTKGHEQKGRRPAIVVSNGQFHRFTNMTIVCPITNKIRSWPSHIMLDDRTKTTGEVICEHLRAVDLSSRNPVFVEQVPPDVLQQIVSTITLFVK